MFEKNIVGRRNYVNVSSFLNVWFWRGEAEREGCGFFKVLRIQSQSFRLVTLTWLKHLASNLVLKLISCVLKPSVLF